MVVDVFNMEGQKVSTVELPAGIFEAPIYADLMHQAFVRQLANARLGTHDTKTARRSCRRRPQTVAQKGTGRARQGSTASAQWKGGGGVHTPHPRSYTAGDAAPDAPDCFALCAFRQRRWKTAW